jgi:glycosyltransferase involved in cell wall biosynthesis
LNHQINEHVEVLTHEDNGELDIGAKRNILLNRASGDYLCFIDDDDRISVDYVDQILNGIKENPDCCSLVGEITFNGKDPKMFVHSIDYNEYFEKNGVYYRPPNHLNAIRSDIAKKFVFPSLNHGEDTDWALQIRDANVLKKESKIQKTIYYYDYITEK